MLRVARFLRGYGADPAPWVRAEEAGGDGGRAILFRPAEARRPLPGWVVLHGITATGVDHPALLRFARSVAASGAAVLVPEVEAWRDLRVAPAEAGRAIDAAARLLAARGDVATGGIGVVGFSFGATQALVAAGRDPRVRRVVGFGGYCDLARTIRFMLTGEHEWRGESHRLEPDPYGRWIVAANYLTRAEGYSGAEGVAAGVRALAAEAGLRGVYAGDPLYDPLKAELRRGLARAERPLWDLLAPPVGARPDAAEAERLAARLVEVALRDDPLLDPRPVLPALDRRLVLVHGRGDHLVPFTETLRMASLLPPAAAATVRITRLFAHSGGAPAVPWRQYPGELWRYATVLREALRD